MTESAEKVRRLQFADAPGALTPIRPVAPILSRVWAWAFLALMILLFVVAVPLSTGGAVNFLTVRHFFILSAPPSNVVTIACINPFLVM